MLVISKPQIMTVVLG